MKLRADVVIKKAYEQALFGLENTTGAARCEKSAELQRRIEFLERLFDL